MYKLSTDYSNFLMIEICESTYCSFGAKCIVDESGDASCQCDDDCSPDDYSPVCGESYHTSVIWSLCCLTNKFVLFNRKRWLYI